jgi:hypothetical protein
VSDEFKLQYSAKTNAGDMLNLRASNGAEFTALLDYAEQNIARIVAIGDLVRAVGTAGDAGLTSPQSSSNVTPFPQQQAQAAAPSNAPVCQHGPRVHKTGKGKKGAWAAWFCDTPQGASDKCDPIWID